MLLVELAVLTREAGPLFAIASLLAIPLALLIAPRGVAFRQRVAMVALLVVAATLEIRPLMATRAAGVPSAYALSYAIRGDRNATPLVEQWIGYAAADGSPLRLLLVRGSARGLRPTTVVIYGGAWRGGSPTQALDVSRYFARRGYTVVAIDYRHAPAHHYPAAIDDVRISLALIRDSSTAWGIDTARVALVGRSAGGHLALLAAFAPQPAARPLPIRAVVAFYAPFDLAEAYRDLPHPDPIDVRHVLRDFIGGSPSEEPERFHAASPASYVRGGLPATLLVYAAQDHLVLAKFGREAAAALRDAQSPVTYVELPWAEHGFDLLPNGIGSQLAIGLLQRFFDATLRH